MNLCVEIFCLWRTDISLISFDEHGQVVSQPAADPGGRVTEAVTG